MQDSVERLASAIRSSQVLRLLSIGFLALLLQIPIAMISGLVSERQQRRSDAIGDVASKWGRTQSITGPALIVPYTYRSAETLPAGQVVNRVETRQAVFLPEGLHVRGSIDSEVRHRGIFSVSVYRLVLHLEGEFARPSFADLGLDPSDAQWQRALLAVGISDSRAIQNEVAVDWNGVPVPFLPGAGVLSHDGGGIHADVGLVETAGQVKFSIPISLNGSQGVYLAPFGRSTVVELESNDGHPSFQGGWLPRERTVSGRGFEAKWSIPFLGRNFPQAWKANTDVSKAIDESRFGVELVSAVDHYRMADRSVKYAGLFVVLTFATVWLIEVLAAVRVHPIQYLTLGAALCVFYLLELSLSEHLGFPLAYAIASVSVIAMVTGYSVAMLGSARRGAFVGLGVAMLYAYLYVLLMNEDYALLSGSIGLFVILGAIMYATRRVDWYSIGRKTP